MLYASIDSTKIVPGLGNLSPARLSAAVAAAVEKVESAKPAPRTAAPRTAAPRTAAPKTAAPKTAAATAPSHVPGADVRPPPAGIDGPRRSGYVLVKAGVEWALALTLFVLTAPLLFALAAAVKLTSAGPAFYSQMRLGRNGRRFAIYKLRTMTHNCEAATGPVWAAKDDPRATPVGKFLRVTHLDEVPQLWNVLRGDMALIGPRPERPEIAARIERRLPAYGGRLLVRPGVTGLAQMRLPADSTLEGVREKLAHDLYYVREVGPMLDLRIAVCTAAHFTAEGLAFVCKALVRYAGARAERGLDRLALLPEEPGYDDVRAGAA